MNIIKTALLEKMLDFSSARHRVIANNLSNIDTPGYKAKSFSFEKRLKEALGGGSGIPMMKTNMKHMDSRSTVEELRGKYGEKEGASLRNDGNSVDIDKEMVLMAENNLLFSVFSRITGHKFSMLENVIKEGRR